MTSQLNLLIFVRASVSRFWENVLRFHVKAPDNSNQTFIDATWKYWRSFQRDIKGFSMRSYDTLLPGAGGSEKWLKQKHDFYYPCITVRDVFKCLHVLQRGFYAVMHSWFGTKIIQSTVLQCVHWQANSWFKERWTFLSKCRLQSFPESLKL